MSGTDQSPDDRDVNALLAEAGWVLELAKRLARDQAAAEDIAQSTLALALERRPSTGNGLRPWLARVTHRLARRDVRSDVRRRTREVDRSKGRDNTSEPAGEVLERFEIQQDLARRVDGLPDPYRRVLIFRYFEGLSVNEIARVTSVAPSTIRTQLARALERIRLQYGQDVAGNTDGRSALGSFVIASGSSSGFVSRRVAEIFTMQTSTKIVGATVAAAAVALAIATIGPDFGRTGGGQLNEPDPATRRLDVSSVTADGEPIVAAPNGDESRTAAGTKTASAGVRVDPSMADVAASQVTTLRARILGHDKKPLAGASLTSVLMDGRPRSVDSVAVSGQDGRVVLEMHDDVMRMSSGRALDMLFSASASGHATTFTSQAPRTHGVTDLGDLRLLPGGTMIGRSVDKVGRPIANALIFAGPAVIAEDPSDMHLRGPRASVARAQTTSGPDGRFELIGIETPPEGQGSVNVRVWAHAPGHLWAISEPVQVAANASVDVGSVTIEELSRAHRIEGIVLRADGLPAAGAQIEAYPPPCYYEPPIVADAHGHFTVIPWDDEPRDIIARAPDGELGVSLPGRASRGGSVRLQLAPRSVMVVTVSNQRGEPVPEAHVMPFYVDDTDPTPGASRYVPGENWSTTGADGRVEIETPGAAFTLSVKKLNAEEIHAGPFEHGTAPAELAVRLTTGPDLTGRVLAYGVPVKGARVIIGSAHRTPMTMTDGFANRFLTSGRPTVRTDADGRFRTSFDASWSRVPVIAEMDGFAPADVMVNFDGGDEVHGVVLHLTTGGAIEGEVSAPPEMEASDMYVAASQGNGDPISVKVDERGRYRFDGLTPGKWRVEGRRHSINNELVFAVWHPDDREFRWNTSVEDGKTTKFDVDLSDLGNVEIVGKLLVDGAAPPAGWTVELILPYHQRYTRVGASASLTSDGTFTMDVSQGRAELKFLGTLPGGASIEMYRSVQLSGSRFDWTGSLKTARVRDAINGTAEFVRFVRGDPRNGNRELTIAPVADNGAVTARVPIGESTLQAQSANRSTDDEWTDVKQISVVEDDRPDRGQ